VPYEPQLCCVHLKPCPGGLSPQDIALRIWTIKPDKRRTSPQEAATMSGKAACSRGNEKEVRSGNRLLLRSAKGATVWHVKRETHQRPCSNCGPYKYASWPDTTREWPRASRRCPDVFRKASGLEPGQSAGQARGLCSGRILVWGRETGHDTGYTARSPYCYSSANG